MATMLSKLVIGITGDPSGFTKGVDVASAKVTDLGNKTKIAFDKVNVSSRKGLIDENKLEGMNQKLAAGVGRVTSLSHGFSSLATSGVSAATSFMLIQGSVEALTVGMFAAKTATTMLKAALITTGIGALIVGAGALVGWLSSRGTETGGAVGGAIGGGSRPSGGPLMDRLSSATTDLAGTVGGGGRMGLTEDFARDSSIRGRRLTESARIVGRSEEARDLIGDLASMNDSLRHSAATMGMSAEEVEVYRASLVRVTHDIGGVMVSTTESLSPMERYNARVREINDAFERGLISREKFGRSVDEANNQLTAQNQLLARNRELFAARSVVEERARLVGEAGLAISGLGSSAAVAAPAGLERGAVATQSAINAALREAAGQQNTDQQIIELNREQNRLLSRQLAEAERVASILGAAQLADNVREVLGF